LVVAYFLLRLYAPPTTIPNVPPSTLTRVADILKDISTLLVAIPAAWLGYCFQRRSAYLQQLRTLYTKLVIAIQDCITYTHHANPTEAEYAKTLNTLSVAIEEIRGVFMNFPKENSTGGIFPFEAVKSMIDEVTSLKSGDDFKKDDAAKRRRNIVEMWKAIREPFLLEFDRDFPSYPVSPYLFKHRVQEISVVEAESEQVAASATENNLVHATVSTTEAESNISRAGLR